MAALATVGGGRQKGRCFSVFDATPSAGVSVGHRFTAGWSRQSLAHSLGGSHLQVRGHPRVLAGERGVQLLHVPAARGLAWPAALAVRLHHVEQHGPLRRRRLQVGHDVVEQERGVGGAAAEAPERPQAQDRSLALRGAEADDALKRSDACTCSLRWAPAASWLPAVLAAANSAASTSYDVSYLASLPWSSLMDTMYLMRCLAGAAARGAAARCGLAPPA